MILRRPYAFLIKNFRLIHIILFILFSYITFKANNILNFFKEYINNNGNIEVIASDYVGASIFISVVLIIAISVIIFLLMRYKQKPRLFYIVLVVISIISSMAFVYLHGSIKNLETSIELARTIRLLRDLSRFHFYMLFITCIPILIRGLGFDIKKFDFNKDLHELKLEAKDNEEVEVTLDLSSDEVKRTGRKVTRELKYYYFENKLFIDIILGVIGIILILIFPFNKFILKGNLSEGGTLSTSNFNIRVNESYISDRNRISKDNSYLILKVELKGKTNKYKLNLDEFILEGRKNDYVPSMKYYNYFTDLGIGYKNRELSTDEYKEYLLIFNIKNEDKKYKFKLNYIGSDRKIKLSPEVID